MISAHPVHASAGQFVVLSGPTAVGKSTVVRLLRERVENLYFSISMTTRAPRPGEVDGRDYFFVTPEEFQRNIDAGLLLEWADIHGGLQRSGTPAAPVYEAVQSGRPVLVEVDLAGARSIAAVEPSAIRVFLAPPSWDVLKERLLGRGTETPDVIERRLHTAKIELAARDEFDYVIVNDDVETAAARIQSILECGKDCLNLS